MAKYTQDNFAGGLQIYGSDVDIPENGYQWLLNCRTREGSIKPISKHLEITNLPSGKKQGIATLGNILIVFIAGAAYYQLFGTDEWVKVGGFSMSATVDRFYTALVPQSVVNFKRTLPSSGNIYSDMQLFPTSITSGTPSGLVVQDGTNQPYLIYIREISTGDNVVTSRILQDFYAWRQTSTTSDRREYVPIGKQMMYLNNKLFIVAVDGTKIYQSVTGRPLDFMVNVDVNGNKGASEATSGAASTSFTFDYEAITAIFPISVPDSFLYTTARQCRIVTLDYNKTIFGEPTYRETGAAIPSGNINHVSVTEILGDYVVIDRESVTAFNPVKQLKIEGKNSIFSRLISTALKNIKQTDKVCVGSYDDYRLFSVQSIFGPILAIFDVIQNLWISFDITPIVQPKEFVTLATETTKEFYCVTWDNKCFKLFADTEDAEMATLRTRAFVREDAQKEQKAQTLKLTFVGGSLTDTCRIVEYVDEQYSQEKTIPLRFREQGINYPVRPPVIMPNESLNTPITFTIPTGRTGRKFWYVIHWTGTAALDEIELVTTDINREAAQQQSSAEANK